MSSKFYTFYDFSYNNGFKPFKKLVDQKLKKNLEKIFNANQNLQEEDYFEHFRSIFLDSSKSNLEKSLAHSHLVAYIDLPRCNLIWHNFHRFPFYAAKAEEYHALTNEILWQTDKLTNHLKNYNSQNSEKASIKTYILSILEKSIRAKINLRSDWHLLCNVDINSSRKINNFGQKIRIALESYGLKESSVFQYVFAWKLFLPIYKNNLINNPHRNRQLKWPNPSKREFIEAANKYNTQRFIPNAPMQVAGSKEITAEIIEEWINTCIRALRQVETITQVSYDDLSSNYEKYEGQIENNIEQELVFIESANSILELKIEQTKITINKVNSQIPKKYRKTVVFFCFLNRFTILNQEQLAKIFDLNQGTISRFISRYLEILLLEEIKKTSYLFNNNESYINKFLSERFVNPDKSKILDILLLEAIDNLEVQEQLVLRLYYGQNKNLLEIKSLIDFDKKIKDHEIEKIKNKIQLNLVKLLDKLLKKSIKLWLRNYHDNQIKNILIQRIKEFNKLNLDIFKKRFCQKMKISEISKLYPQFDINQILSESIQELNKYLIEWIEENLPLFPKTYHIQVSKVIEKFLESLIYIQI